VIYCKESTAFAAAWRKVALISPYRGDVDRYYFGGTMQKGLLVVPLDGDPLIFVEKGMERALMETPLPITPIKADREIREIIGAGKVNGRKGWPGA